jgi:hypothetical protein
VKPFGDNHRVSAPNPHPPSELTLRIHQAIAQAGGWIGFDRFMAMALYEPGLGYYTNALQKFGAMPSSGSDFVTAPGMSPLFGQTLAVQVREALDATGTHEVWEFGAGTGALALQLLDSLGDVRAPLHHHRFVGHFARPSGRHLVEICRQSALARRLARRHRGRGGGQRGAGRYACATAAAHARRLA